MPHHVPVELDDLAAVSGEGVTFVGFMLRLAKIEQVLAELQEGPDGQLADVGRFIGWEEPSDLDVDPVLGGQAFGLVSSSVPKCILLTVCRIFE